MSELLQDMTSRDATRVWSGSCAIIKLRDTGELDLLAANIDVIRRETENLQLGGQLFPNAEHLRLALRKLRYYRAHSGCLCALYPEYLMYNPQEEARAGNVVIERVIYLQDKYVDAYICTCTTCGTRYRVEEREYHYMWWGWKAEPETAGDARNA